MIDYQLLQFINLLPYTKRKEEKKRKLFGYQENVTWLPWSGEDNTKSNSHMTKSVFFLIF